MLKGMALIIICSLIRAFIVLTTDLIIFHQANIKDPDQTMQADLDLQCTHVSYDHFMCDITYTKNVFKTWFIIAQFWLHCIDPKMMYPNIYV